MDDLVKIFLILDARRNFALQPIVKAHRAARHDAVGDELRKLFEVDFRPTRAGTAGSRAVAGRRR